MAPDSELQPLAWESIPYGYDEIHRVPDDKRGIYAVAINYPSDVLPPNNNSIPLSCRRSPSVISMQRLGK